MSIPAFFENGWLPEGHHPANWEEVAGQFGGEAGSRRAAILSGLLRWREPCAAKAWVAD